LHEQNKNFMLVEYPGLPLVCDLNPVLFRMSQWRSFAFALRPTWEAGVPPYEPFETAEFLPNRSFLNFKTIKSQAA
jgi:hypothetical protein